MFEAGAIAHVADEAARLGMSRALVIATPGSGARLGARLVDILGARAAGLHAQAVVHVPKAVAEAGLAAAVDADGLVAAAAGRPSGWPRSLPAIARCLFSPYRRPIPDRSDPIWGMSEGERKFTGKDAHVLPRTIVYDPDLTLGLPAAVSAASAMNAIAHCVEGLWGPTARRS